MGRIEAAAHPCCAYCCLCRPVACHCARQTQTPDPPRGNMIKTAVDAASLLMMGAPAWAVQSTMVVFNSVVRHAPALQRGGGGVCMAHGTPTPRLLDAAVVQQCRWLAGCCTAARGSCCHVQAACGGRLQAEPAGSASVAREQAERAGQSRRSAFVHNGMPCTRRFCATAAVDSDSCDCVLCARVPVGGGAAAASSPRADLRELLKRAGRASTRTGVARQQPGRACSTRRCRA